MTDTAQFEEEAFDLETFFARYWRSRPMFIRGGAAAFLGRTWSGADFDRVAAMAQADGERVKEQPGQVAFVEEASAYDTDLAERAAGFAACFGAPRAWFDTVRTDTVSGIGAHFDHSDNFVLQQDGVKHWSLAPPERIEPHLAQKRMLNMSSVGSHPLPWSGTLKFVLQPGDLLYIPLLWLHHGRSQGPSLSLSLVCPAVSLYAAVVPFLARVLKQQLIGAEPIAALHPGLSQQQRATEVERIREATMALLSRMSSDDIAQAVYALQDRHLTKSSP